MSTIFVSSTFQDMQQERDILQNYVLPKVKEFAKQYGKNIDLCDLRWGINSIGMSEAESTAKVLQVCFDEIDNARPFFIALLGDRYGWIPNSDVIEVSTIGRNIDRTDLIGKSVTEMEIIYGALKSTDSSDIRFYFREIENKKRGLFQKNSLPRYFTDETIENQKRMNDLKEKIKTRFSEQVRTYSVSWNKYTSKLDGLESFGEMLYQDITEMIIKRWGAISELSEYEYQLHQYQYILDNDRLFVEGTEALLSSEVRPDILKINENTMNTQNYVLVSQDEHSLNILFSTLCKRYQSANSIVVPYECGQSVLSSSTENMLRYFIDIIESRICEAMNITLPILSLANLDVTEKFCNLLRLIDDLLEQPLILAVRNIQYLNNNNVFAWLPLDNFKKIRFLLSCNSVFAGPSQFKEITSEFYFANSNVINRNRLIKSYMGRYHKELDEQVCFALLDKAKDKDDQYLELLMQRLLVLSQEDFEIIQKRGDGIDNISLYLQEIIHESPDSTIDFILRQLYSLEKEISSGFVRAVLAILYILPYGISLSELQEVLKEGNIPFSILEMTILCRRFSSMINVTIDGYYRIIQTPITKILSDVLLAEIAEWNIILERYMSYSSDVNKSHKDGYIVTECYRSQYLEIALKTNKTSALIEYLKNIDFDVSYFGLVLYRLVTKFGNAAETLKDAFSHLSATDIQWMATELYSLLSDQKMLLNKDFALSIIVFWKEMLICWEKSKKSSELYNYIHFKLLYELGELSYLHNVDDAEHYLLTAKQVSKENFRQYPNRLWKVIHGIELTDEEKHRGYDSLDSNLTISNRDSVMFGFSGEVEDMEFEQSWSDRVRVINNYLAQEYRKRGKIKEAETLEAESKLISHISDPDPKQNGQNELVSGIKLIWPDELDNNFANNSIMKKRHYKPDLRRNSAIQLAKEAGHLHAEGKNKEAIGKYIESNEVLKEIYEDGHTGEYYDLRDIIEDTNNVRIMIQKECARDLGLNYYHMIYCVPMNERDSCLRSYVDDMLAWAHIYDDYRNNIQSKEGLEDYYLLSAAIYNGFEDNSSYYERIIRDIDRYYTYRLEAHLNGEQTDETIMDNRVKAGRILFDTVIKNPDIGSHITDLLLKHSNACVKANDFNGFLQLTELIENLLKWMWDNSYMWKGTHCSLEELFFSNIDNQCMLWEKHHMLERLEQDANRLVDVLHNVDEADSILKGIQSIMRYAMQIFCSGSYQDAVSYADVIFKAIQRTSSLPDIELASIYEKLLAIYSEAEFLEKAHLVAVQNEVLLEKIATKGFSEEHRAMNITPSQFNSFVISKTIIAYLNHSVALSRMEKHEEAERYLSKAEQLSAKYPGVVASEDGIIQRISLFRKYGLPKPKTVDDSEKVYRKFKSEIETILSECLKGEPYNISILQHVEKLIVEICDMPEHEIFGELYTVAKYYHVLNMLYASLGRKDVALEMLKRAAKISDSDNLAEALYADIYSDISAYVTDLDEKLRYIQKALIMYEHLQKAEKNYSSCSYAMTLFNASIILMERGEYESALMNAKKAHIIWEKCFFSNPDEQIKGYLSEAKRLITFLQQKIS